MERSEKKKKKRVTGKTVLVCLFLIFVVYIGINIIINSGGSMTTYIARDGEEAESFTAEGFIFKDQTVITAPKAGYLECAVSESGRVSRGGTVAYIYDEEIDISVKNKVAELEEKISKAENDNRSMSASENDAVRLQQDVSSAVSSIALCVRDNDMEALRKIREELDDIVESKRKISGDDPSGEENLKALKEEKASLESKNNMTKTAVKTDVSGSFTATVDGLEDVLDESKLESVTRAYLKGIKTGDDEKKNEAKVESGEAIGKIVDTYLWYFAAVIDKDVADKLTEGAEIKLKFLDSSDTIINGTVYRITDEKDGEAVLIIKSSEYVDNLYSMSSAKVEVIRKTYEGMKIPAKSVRVKDNEKGVYIVSGNTVKFRKAKVYYIDDEWAIVSREEENGIKLYDEVVVSGSNIYEGKVVR